MKLAEERAHLGVPRHADDLGLGVVDADGAPYSVALRKEPAHEFLVHQRHWLTVHHVAGVEPTARV